MLVVDSGTRGVQLHIIKNQIVFGEYSRKIPSRSPFL